MSGVVTLLTDFGTRDPFVGLMKGVLAALAPAARPIDLTHELPPQDVAAGAFWLRQSVPYFPRGTVHLAVVDPGVGTNRRAVAFEARGQLFVGPDNGLFTDVLPEASAVHVLDPARLREVLRAALPDARPTSATFHGRDVFSPAAALLARGEPLTALGPELPEGRDGLQTLGERPPRVEVIDRFGNLITNVPWRAEDGPARVSIRGRTLAWVRTYGEAPFGACVALLGSFGTVEIAVREGSAAETLGVGPREPVEILAGS